MSAQRNISPWRWLLLSIAGAILLVFIIFTIGNMSPSGEIGGGGKKVAIVKVIGPIFKSEDTIKELDEFQNRKDVVAVVLRIDSPGGAIGPSQEIYEKIKSVNDKKPVIISMGSVAASGGYYISLGSKVVMANPGTVTGSIGVIMDYPVVKDLMDKIGVDVKTVKSGDMKDAGSPTREATETDLAYFQVVVMDLYNQFVKAVAKGRNMDINDVKSLADGRIYTGEQSLALGLIDTLGTFEDAIRLAGSLGGIEGVPKTVEPKKKRSSFFEWFFDDKIQEVQDRLTIPRFEYRWR